MSYNRAVRKALITGMLVLAGLGVGTAYGADSADTALPILLARVEAVANDCCRLITVACVELKYMPRCDWSPHQCIEPLAPCIYDICIDAPCHQPVTPCDPGGGWCLPAGCHLPAAVALPEDCCD